MVSDVPPEVCILEFGATLYGTGEFWTDDFQIDIASTNAPITDDRIWHTWSPNAADYSVTVDPNHTMTARKPPLAFTPEGAPLADRGCGGPVHPRLREIQRPHGAMTVWIKSEKASGNMG